MSTHILDRASPRDSAKYPRHEEVNARIELSPDELFAALDNHARLSSHMSKSSWLMGGGKMEIVVDEQRGQAAGSHIILQGRAFGISIRVEEVVTVREPALRKVWETVGEPRLLVIGGYRMGFDIEPEGGASQLRVSIDYDLPQRGFPRLLGLLFGWMYAKWCTRQMVIDAGRLKR